MTFRMTQTERELSEAGRDIGSMAESNAQWFAGLADLVEATGKPVDDLTIGELRSLIEQRTETYNRIYARIEAREMGYAKCNAI